MIKDEDKKEIVISKKETIELSEQSGTNHLKEILQFKIVYWGPGESGKTTNYFHLRKKYSGIKLSSGISIETTDGRTLWQDSVRLSFFLNIGEIKYNIITQIVTCTGQERFLSTREYVLNGADGVIFVADSDPRKMEHNKRSYRELQGFVGSKVPFLVQLNKRDLKNAVSIDYFKNQLDLPSFEQYEDGCLVVYPCVAIEGENINECFEDLMLKVLFNFFQKN